MVGEPLVVTKEGRKNWIKETRWMMEILEREMEAKDEEPPDEKSTIETAPTLSKRLTDIWLKLGGVISKKQYAALGGWTIRNLAYVHREGTFTPNLREYVRDKLRDLNGEQLTELEAILEQ